MTTATLLRTTWEPEWSINLGCAAMCVLYLLFVRASSRQRLSFFLGIAVMMFALESPLDALGDDYLFSAHMAQHLLLILIVPPLLVAGTPERAVRGWLSEPRVAALEWHLSRPWFAWSGAIVVMTLWHLPILYNFALEHEPVHILQHLSFLVTATIFWWPIMHPLPERRLGIGIAVLYLFAAAAENSILGIILTFMRVGHYPAYLHPDDEWGALKLIRDGWGLSAADDQRLGGLLMWIPGCSVYFIAILALFTKWYGSPEVDSESAQQGGVAG